MKVEIADSGTLGKRLSISYSSDEVRARRQQVLRKLSTEVKMPGFRPGKSSLALVEKRYGGAATSKAEEELANEGFSQAVNEHKLRPIGPVSTPESSRDQGLRLTFAFEVKPTVSLPDPKSLAVTRDEVTVDDAKIDETLTGMARRAGGLNELGADDKLVEDDSITLSGKVTAGDELVREFHDFNHLVGAYPLLGKDAKDVIEMVKDKGVGSTLSFTTVLPQSFKPEAFAGKEARVEFTVQSAKRVRPVPLDDELAKKVGMADLAALRQAVSENLKRTLENQQHQQQLDELIVDLLAKVQVEYPPQLLDSLIKDRREAALREAEEKKLEGAELEAARKAAEEGSRQDAEKNLKRYLALDAVAEAYHVSVTREDLEQQIRMAAQRSGQTPEAIAKRLQDSGRINDVVQEIREAKAMEVLLDVALGRAEPHVHGADCNH